MRGLAIVIAVITAGALVAAEGPIDQGSILIGGGLGFDYTMGDLYENVNGDAAMNINLTPEFGYFVMPSLMVGADLVVEFFSQGDASQTTWGIGPMVGYYLDLGGNTYPYGKLAFRYRMTTDDNYSVTSMEIPVSVGALFMVAKNVGIDVYLNYSFDTMDMEKPVDMDSQSGSDIGINVGISAFIY